jgi:hypothetical protein
MISIAERLKKALILGYFLLFKPLFSVIFAIFFKKSKIASFTKTSLNADRSLTTNGYQHYLNPGKTWT